MIGGIIVTHASFAAGIKEALEMIAGKQHNVAAIGLQEGDGMESLVMRIQETRAMFDCDHVFLFVDMFGATPCNVCSLICSQGGYDVIAGVNLPILLEFVMKREHMSKEELQAAIEKVSKEDFRWITQQDICGNLM